MTVMPKLLEMIPEDICLLVKYSSPQDPGPFVLTVEAYAIFLPYLKALRELFPSISLFNRKDKQGEIIAYFFGTTDPSINHEIADIFGLIDEIPGSSFTEIKQDFPWEQMNNIGDHFLVKDVAKPDSFKVQLYKKARSLGKIFYCRQIESNSFLVLLVEAPGAEPRYIVSRKEINED